MNSSLVSLICGLCMDKKTAFLLLNRLFAPSSTDGGMTANQACKIRTFATYPSEKSPEKTFSK